MGYWSTHPMGGDSPQDASCYLFGYVARKEGLEKWDFDEHDYLETCKVLNKYKYDILDNFTNFMEENHSYYADLRFVVPFTFIEYDIRFPEEKEIKRVISFLGDGGTSRRGYDESEDSSPQKICNLVRKHSKYLFDSNVTIEEMQKNIPENELKAIYGVTLLEAIFENLEQNKKGLINKK